jgi:hypothetical protein
MYAPHSIAAIVAELVNEGVNATVALEGTGLTNSQLNVQTTRISYQQLDVVIHNALGLSSDPAIALRAGLRMHITTYGMYGYALLSSATHAEARDFAARYVRVVGPFCDFLVAYDGETVHVTFEPLHWPNPTEGIHRFAIEFALSAHLTTIRDRVGGGFGFSQVSLDYPAPSHAADYEGLFKCPVMFEQGHCGYEHVREEGPSTLADPRTHAMAREICEQLLDDVNRAGGIAADVRQILIEHPGRYPSIETIADVSSRAAAQARGGRDLVPRFCSARCACGLPSSICAKRK